MRMPGFGGATCSACLGVWVPYAEAKPPADATVIGGSWRNTLCFGFHWSMSSSFEPGRHHNIDADRTHWLALPPPPQPNSQSKEHVPES